MAAAQLRLVQDQAPGFNAETSDPTRRIFEHWLFMAGRSPRRCKMGPTRRAAINAALSMGYDVDTLLMAVEGMAADPLDDCTVDRIRDAMREIEWLLAREARIERWADRGEALRVQVAEETARAGRPVVVAAEPELDPAEVERKREALRAWALRSRQGALHG